MASLLLTLDLSCASVSCNNKDTILVLIEDMHGLKIDTNFFLKMLNGEWL